MAGLLDIAPVTETVAGVKVHGVSARGVVHLISQFPELKALMVGRNVDQDALVAMAPRAVAAIIAAGCGFPGDVEQEEQAASLSIDLQADFLAAILRLTIPKGVQPFLDKLTATGVRLQQVEGAAPSATAPDTKSRKGSRRS